MIKNSGLYLKNLYKENKSLIYIIELNNNWPFIVGEISEYTKPLKLISKNLFISVKQYYIIQFKQCEQYCINAINIYYCSNIIEKIVIIPEI